MNNDLLMQKNAKEKDTFSYNLFFGLRDKGAMTA
jgi:hypothetical protein